jgi:hypothetical protein
MKFFTDLTSGNRILLACCLLVAVTFSQPHYGFMMFFFAPLVLIYQLFKLVRCWKIPGQRKDRFVALAIVAVAILAVACAHDYHRRVARNVAEKLVGDIANFQKKNNGRYPANLTELGVSALTQKHYRLFYYTKDGERPSLLYGATLVAFYKWRYNFSVREWEHLPD